MDRQTRISAIPAESESDAATITPMPSNPAISTELLQNPFLAGTFNQMRKKLCQEFYRTLLSTRLVSFLAEETFSAGNVLTLLQLLEKVIKKSIMVKTQGSPESEATLADDDTTIQYLLHALLQNLPMGYMFKTMCDQAGFSSEYKPETNQYIDWRDAKRRETECLGYKYDENAVTIAIPQLYAGANKQPAILTIAAARGICQVLKIAADNLIFSGKSVFRMRDIAALFSAQSGVQNVITADDETSAKFSAALNVLNRKAKAENRELLPREILFAIFDFIILVILILIGFFNRMSGFMDAMIRDEKKDGIFVLVTIVFSVLLLAIFVFFVRSVKNSFYLYQALHGKNSDLKNTPTAVHRKLVQRLQKLCGKGTATHSREDDFWNLMLTQFGDYLSEKTFEAPNATSPGVTEDTRLLGHSEV